MTVFAANGAKLYISDDPVSSEPAPANAAAYQALDWTQIGELESLGTFGDSANQISFAALEDQRTRHFKGARDAGTLDVVFGRDYADAGQTLLLTAEAEIHDRAFKVLFNDAPPSGTPSERYFVAAVGSATETVDSSDSVIKLNSSLWINSSITRVNAAEA